MKSWKLEYKGHRIEVQNMIIMERLFIDDELQDEYAGFAMRSRLSGIIRDGNGAGEVVRASLGGWRVQCRIFVDNRLAFHSKPDKVAAAILDRNSDK